MRFFSLCITILALLLLTCIQVGHGEQKTSASKSTTSSGLRIRPHEEYARSIRISKNNQRAVIDLYEAVDASDFGDIEFKESRGQV
jgi:hypothetical protein